MVRLFLVFMLAFVGAAHAQSFRDCPTCPEMVTIPPGAFTMGPAAGEEDREGVPENIRNGSTHRVTIGYAFAIGKYEVTRAEFAAFVAATGHQTGNSCWGFSLGSWWLDPRFAQTDREPVVCVSWDDAKAYATWLSQSTGKGYRLPSEAEWEYAARAGSQTARYWGDSHDGACSYGNFADLTGASAFNWPKKPESIFLCRDGHVYTAPVGSFQPNAFGLYDMLGNATEWTEDCYNASYHGAPTNGHAWLTGDCSRHILRGSSWDGAPWRVRSAFRDRVPAGIRLNDVGFRVVRTNFRVAGTN